jgi:hypothetical protein
LLNIFSKEKKMILRCSQEQMDGLAHFVFGSTSLDLTNWISQVGLDKLN